MLIHYPEYQGSVVFVTGANSGIGYSQAVAFLEQGAKVFGLDKNADSMTELQQKYPENFLFTHGDIREMAILEEAVTTCLAQFETIDILLNTAGILDDYLPLHETSHNLWETVFAVNVTSQFNLTKLVLPIFLEKQTGCIINMASIAGLVAGGGGVAYTSAKHAIVGFTKQLALDYADKNIRIKGIAPGAIETPMNAADFVGDGEMAKWVASETPVKRWANPDEVAQLTLFLASQQASYLQGNIVPIDGGWLLK
ncbi:3-oxoacyl-ACP reductase [Vagococcus hydrophili]|uniref:3-oxoacyl-ACP reductase n=1 Tax=Vagococcus hydrophili TaxID=2714947 RepID=A0A6G8AXC2_9ENTE|nr:3-oxoacyl-ACP reductase [Vagococcus hydrophili]QIL49751.1 3-oxoacyl-ACP reductase [Vagococcus hydrophili]